MIELFVSNLGFITYVALLDFRDWMAQVEA
jgi:hypothetical protein